MPDGSTDADYRIRFVTSSDLTGANATVASVKEVGQATQSQLAIIREATTANAQAAIAIREASAATAQTAVIAREYGVSLETAARAAQVLAQANVPLVAGSAELEAALESVVAAQAAAAQSVRTYNAELTASAEAAMRAGVAEEELGEISASLAPALARLGIAESEVAAKAEQLGLSLDVAGRAMIRLRQAALSEEIDAAAAAMQALEGSTLGAAAAQTELSAQAEVAQASTMKFGRGSPAFHAMVAASNVTQGGARAMRGWVEAAELAGVAFGGIVGPLILVSAVVGEIVARYEEHNGKLRDARGEVDEYAQAWSLASAQVTGYKAELDGILAVQKQQMEIDDRMLANARERAGLLKEDAKQDQEKRLQDLRNQYLQDEARPQSASDRKELKDRYDASRQDIEQGGLVNTSILEAAEAQQQLELTRRKLADAQAAHNADILTAAEAYKNAEEARKRLEPYGISLFKDGKEGTELNYIDPSGNPSGDPSKAPADVNPITEIKSKIADAEKAYALEKSLFNSEGTPMSGVPVVNQPMLDETAATLVSLRKRRDQLEADQAALVKESETNKAIGSKLPEQADVISKLQDQVADLQAQLGQKQTGVGIAITNKEQDDRQAALDKSARGQQALRDAQKNESDAKIANLQAQLDAAQGAAKIPIQNQLTAAQQQAVKDEANFTSGVPIALPTAPETPSQKQHAASERNLSAVDQRIKQLEQQQRNNPDVATLIQKQIDALRPQREKAFEAVQAPSTSATPPTPQQVLDQSVRDKANADVRRVGAAGQEADSRDQSQAQRAQAQQERADTRQEKPLVEGAEKTILNEAKIDPALEAEFKTSIALTKDKSLQEQMLGIFKAFNAAVLDSKASDAAVLGQISQELATLKSQMEGVKRGLKSSLNN